MMLKESVIVGVSLFSATKVKWSCLSVSFKKLKVYFIKKTTESLSYMYSNLIMRGFSLA